MLPNIRPIMRIAIVSLILLETDRTAKSTKKLPKLAEITIAHLDIKAVANKPPKRPEPKITKATPKLAPELIPNTNGPAKGFRKRVCINKPEIPKPEPTIIAVKAFGKRTLVMMICQVLFSEVLKRLLKTSEMGICTEPKLMFMTKQAISNRIKIKNGYLKLLFKVKCHSEERGISMFIDAI